MRYNHPVERQKQLEWLKFLMVVRLATSARNGAVSGITGLLDAGAGPGICQIRSLAQPADVNGSDNGTLLATAVFSDPAFPNPTGGSASANPITSDTSADANGTAAHFRLKDSNGAIVLDGTCGQGTGDLSFDNTNIVLGGIVAISSMSVSMPES